MTKAIRTFFVAAGAAVLALVAVTKLTANGETRYKHPGPNAGMQAELWWSWYWTDPHADANRCYFPFIGGQAPALPPPQTGCVNPKPCVPHAAVASGYFSPAIFACSNTPDGCYVDQAGTTQPRRLQKVGWIYGIGSAHGACIVGTDGVCYGLVDQCPNAPSTPTPVFSASPVFTATRTPGISGTPTVTPAGGLICWTITPQVVCVTPTRTP